MSELARLKACFVEEAIVVDGQERTVLLPIASENVLDDGSAWHPETFQPLGPQEAIWLTGYDGLRPFVGHWLPLPYLRMMTAKTGARSRLDQGPQNWVRIFISPPQGRPEDVASLQAVLAIDTRIAGNSRLDQRRYNAPSLDDVNLGAAFVLADRADQLANLLSSAWLNGWLQEILRGHSAPASEASDTAGSFKQGHIARYLFLIKAICEACPAPILKFASKARETSPIEAISHELILDMADDVGLAVLSAHGRAASSAGHAPTRVVPIRDLSQPASLHLGALPIRVEFDTASFGLPRFSRQSGRTDAFNWPSLVRIGEEAARIALRPNAIAGTTGSTGLARQANDVTPNAETWRCSSETAHYGKRGQPSRSTALQFFDESGAFDRTGTTPPTLRPRFSRSSLLTLFIAELVLQAISSMNTPHNTTTDGDTSTGQPGVLEVLRLSLPVSIAADEREAILGRAKDGIDFAWRAQGWENDPNGLAPPKPAVELGLGGDFGAQLVYLQDQLGGVYGGDIAAFVEDLNPIRGFHNGTGSGIANETGRALQFASIALGVTATRVVVADYNLNDRDSIRPQLLSSQIEARGVDDIHDAIIDHYLMPAVRTALLQCNANLAAGVADALLGRQPSGATTAQDTGLPDDITLRLEDKILRPAARTLLTHYAKSPSGGAGIEQLTLAGLIDQGGGRLKPMDDIVDNIAGQLGAEGFQLAQVKVPFARHTFRKAILGRLENLINRATASIDAERTDLILVTSAYASSQDVRDQILSQVPISPHRLVMLNEDWMPRHNAIDHAGEIDAATCIGVLGSVIGKSQMWDYKGLTTIDRPLQLNTEVA